MCDVGAGPSRTANLAAWVAAKEACLTLFPREPAPGLIGPVDFALARAGYGVPRVVCSPRALELIVRRRLKAITVSFAQDRASASAVAVAERASPGDQGPRQPHAPRACGAGDEGESGVGSASRSSLGLVGPGGIGYT